MLLVFINKSKIQFEIYSQRKLTCCGYGVECLSINQRYNLKSIHNEIFNQMAEAESVYQ